MIAIFPTVVVVFATPPFKLIKLITSATGITVKANAATNTYTMPLLVNSVTEIDNDGEIDSLIFAGTGNVKIEGN